MKIDILEERIIDWYDGPVRSLVRAAGTHEWLYSSLISWDMVGRSKISVALRLDSEWLEKLLPWANGGHPHEPDMDWDDFLSLERSLIGAYNGCVFLLALSDSMNKQFSFKGRFSIDLVRSELGSGIEGAISPERVDRWSQFLESRTQDWEGPEIM